MNRGKVPVKGLVGGYTIIETLIFLAVSALIFFSAMQLIGGRQGRAQFAGVVRDFETRLTDIANDTATGYYQSDGSFSCDKNASGELEITNSDRTQGTNKDCIFVGTVLKLGEGGSETDRERFTQLVVAGLRTDAAGFSIGTLADAKPKVVDVENTYDRAALGYGAYVSCVAVGPSCGAGDQSGAIGFFTRFTGTGPLSSSSLQTDVMLYKGASGVTIGRPATDVIGDIDNATTDPTKRDLNPSNGITICLRSGTTNQYALVHIGGKGNNLTFSNEIKNGSSCS